MISVSSPRSRFLETGQCLQIAMLRSLSLHIGDVGRYAGHGNGTSYISMRLELETILYDSFQIRLESQMIHGTQIA